VIFQVQVLPGSAAVIVPESGIAIYEIHNVD
jgi:hypothetical protein